MSRPRLQPEHVDLANCEHFPVPNYLTDEGLVDSVAYAIMHRILRLCFADLAPCLLPNKQLANSVMGITQSDAAQAIHRLQRFGYLHVYHVGNDRQLIPDFYADLIPLPSSR